MATIYGTKNDDHIDAVDGVTDQRDIIFGGDGDDEIHSFGGNDVLKGGGGADRFYGGSGFDWVDYSDSPDRVFIHLDENYGLGGTAQGDRFFDVENVTGSSYDDWIEGNGADNTLRGSGGSDTLVGNGGSDVLEGGDGRDYLFGGTFGDMLYGGHGDDLLRGQTGADHLFGGDGYDEASYDMSPEGVVVSLMHGLAARGHAQGDTLDSIEKLHGSDFSDHLYGDDDPNSLLGDDGNDTLKGYGGNDYLYGGGDADTLIGGDGVDELDGGAGADLFIWTDTGETDIHAATADRIIGFHAVYGDRIDLSGIDADVYTPGNQAFTFIGTAAFSGTPGEINYYQVGNETFFQLQTGQSADVEGVIRIGGILTPEASWFIL